jgi:hypothetical protein
LSPQLDYRLGSWILTSPYSHQPRKRTGVFVFGVSTVLLQPLALKTSAFAHFRGFYLSLATTSPENKHDCSSSGFLPFSGINHPRKRARLLVFGVSTFLWPPSTPQTSTTARLRGLDLSPSLASIRGLDLSLGSCNEGILRPLLTLCLSKQVIRGLHAHSRYLVLSDATHTPPQPLVHTPLQPHHHHLSTTLMR